MPSVQHRAMHFELASAIAAVETIAEGHGIRELSRLRRVYGTGNWKKKKGIGTVRLGNGVTAVVELHWYEAHGIGRREVKIKTILRVLP
jgi:hypothetical protein